MTSITFSTARTAPSTSKETFVHRITSVLGEWRERMVARAQLAQMSEHQLKDIGLSRNDAVFEAQKPMWAE
jgi:uncharacterized protein YjiS (DUF1127 family)